MQGNSNAGNSLGKAVSVESRSCSNQATTCCMCVVLGTRGLKLSKGRNICNDFPWLMDSLALIVGEAVRTPIKVVGVWQDLLEPIKLMASPAQAMPRPFEYTSCLSLKKHRSKKPNHALTCLLPFKDSLILSRAYVAIDLLPTAPAGAR